MILNSSETSGPLSNGRILKMCSLEVYIKSFGGQKGGSLEPPRTPPLPTGLGSKSAIFVILSSSSSSFFVQTTLSNNDNTKTVQALTLILARNECSSQRAASQPLSVFIASNSPWSIKAIHNTPWLLFVVKDAIF